jgi:hypothetical protein
MKKAYLSVLLALVTLPAQSAIIKDGSFYDYVTGLKDQAFTKNSGDYVPPTAGQRSDFSLLAKSLYDHNWSVAETQAHDLGYDLVQFNNSTTQDVYWGVAEQLIAGKQSKGWGSYFVNEASTSNVTIEVNHPSNDTNTHRLGARVFERSDANAFAIAGAHRSANGYQTANPTSLEYSIFQEVHKIFNGGYGDSTAWQLHGFGSSTLRKFPEGTDAVLSDGAGNVTNELATLDRLLEEIDDSHFGTSYVYNLLDKDDPLNIQVNGMVQDGHDPFYHLRAFNNPQGQFSRDAGGSFVHIEASYNIRGSRTKRDTYFANVIVDAIKETSTGTAGYIDSQINEIPEPSSTMLFLASLFVLPLWRKTTKT